MNKFVNSIKAKVNGLAISAMTRTRSLLTSIRGEGYVDTGLKILIAVVIGALLLAGLYALFGDTILPTLEKKVKELFNFKG